MTGLNSLQNTTRPKKTGKRVGRGIGSGKGKTCGRGEKGMGSRAGAKSRLGYEGGQFRTFMKFPIRGFSNVRFRKALHSINLSQIEKMFEEGDVVNVVSLKQHGYINGKCYGVKILGNGELKKKVKIEACAFSESAREKLQNAKIQFTVAE